MSIETLFARVPAESSIGASVPLREGAGVRRRRASTLMLAAERADSLAADEEALELYTAVDPRPPARVSGGRASCSRATRCEIGERTFAGRHQQPSEFELSLSRIGHVGRASFNCVAAVGRGCAHMAARLARSTARRRSPAA